MAETILIVDDNREIVDSLGKLLQLEGYDILEAFDGMEALEIMERHSVDLILLDVMMPRLNGLSALMKIRENYKIPAIILSAKTEESDKVSGLVLGADDYIMKPFDSKEMVARVRAVLRRYQAAPKPSESTDCKGKCVTYPGITINLTNYSVAVDGENVDMPPKELELLYFLASSPNQVFTREQLLDQIWGYEYIGDTRTVDVHIKRLREKIKDHDSWRLSTVWGIGYKFEVK